MSSCGNSIPSTQPALPPDTEPSCGDSIPNTPAALQPDMDFDGCSSTYVPTEVCEDTASECGEVMSAFATAVTGKPTNQDAQCGSHFKAQEGDAEAVPALTYINKVIH